jgi:hypothetical protein
MERFAEGEIWFAESNTSVLSRMERQRGIFEALARWTC